MYQAIKDGISDGRLTQEVMPSADGKLRSNGDRTSANAVVDDIEQILSVERIFRLPTYPSTRLNQVALSAPLAGGGVTENLTWMDIPNKKPGTEAGQRHNAMI